jgi:hypothetical protein
MMQHKGVLVIWCRIKCGGMIKGQTGMIEYYVKVKFTLEQVMRAQRDRR